MAAGLTDLVSTGVPVLALRSWKTTFKTFSPPQDHRMIKYYYVVNALVGGYLMARFLHIIDMGQNGIIPG